jgi:hypothetical protein
MLALPLSHDNHSVLEEAKELVGLQLQLTPSIRNALSSWWDISNIMLKDVSNN